MVRAWLVNRSWLVVSSVALLVVLTAGALGVASSSDGRGSIRAAKVDAVAIPIPDPTPVPDACENGATKPFTPTSIDIQDVRDELPILALARDENDVPGVPPITARDAVAWDRPPRGLQPGSPRGNVLLNTHTGLEATVLGNAMLAKVDVGDVIKLRNSETHLCYRVTKRLEVFADEEYEPFYAEDGPPQFAFIVCSGERLGPGEWTKRTIWFGSPIGAGPRSSSEARAHSTSSSRPRSDAVWWVSEKHLLENRFHVLHSLLALKPGTSMVENATSGTPPESDAKRTADPIWPFWAPD